MVSNRASIFFVAGAAVLLCFFFLDIPLPGNDNTELMDMKAQRGTNATEAVLDLEPEDPPPPPLAKTVDLTPLYYSSNTLIRMSKQLRLVAGKLLIYDPKTRPIRLYSISRLSHSRSGPLSSLPCWWAARHYQGTWKCVRSAFPTAAVSFNCFGPTIIFSSSK